MMCASGKDVPKSILECFRATIKKDGYGGLW